MFDVIAEFISTQSGDSAEFIRKTRALIVGCVRGCDPARLYVIRIDNWFGPKWMNFAGKFTVGKGAAIGVHKTRLHVPPFVPHRVVEQRVFVGAGYEQIAVAEPLHIECPSKQALSRRIEDIDKDAVFAWFSGESEAQRRGSVMVYFPGDSDPAASSRADRRRTGAYYVGFSQREAGWEPVMLRGISRGELALLEENGQTLLPDQDNLGG